LLARSRHIGPRTLGRRSRSGAATDIDASETICSRRRSSRSSSVACLGRQSQAWQFQRVTKAFALSNTKSPGAWVTTPRHLQCPTKSTVPNLGTKCGRRERESRHEGRREQSLRGKSIPSCVVTVKGILIFWKAVPFAGCCRNEGLGRSVIR